MGQAHTVKSFRSGNSVAIRIPAGLGLAPKRERTIAGCDGDLVPNDAPKRKFNIARVWSVAAARGLWQIDKSDRRLERPPCPATTSRREGTLPMKPMLDGNIVVVLGLTSDIAIRCRLAEQGEGMSILACTEEVCGQHPRLQVAGWTAR